MPKLETLLKRTGRSNRPQTADEAFAIVQMLNAVHGGNVVGKKG